MPRDHDVRPHRRGRAFSFGVGGAALVVALGLGACKTGRSETEDPTAGLEGGAVDDGLASEGTVLSTWDHPGAGHTSNIDLVVISSDGKAVLTRDQIGGTRLWPRLDGGREPIIIPVQGPQQLSLEPRDPGVFTVAAVDAAGGGRIYGVGDGKVVELGTLAPFQPLFGLYVLPGGERLLGLYRDHSIRLLDRSGAELHRFEGSRFRPTSLRIGSSGKSFVAVSTAVSGGGNRLELQRMQVAGSEAEPTIRTVGSPQVVESATPLSEANAVMSPDAERFAVADKPEGAGWELKIVDLAEPDAAPDAVTVSIPAHLIPNLGFVGPRTLLASTNDGTLSWLVDLEDGTQHARTSAPQDFVNQGRAQALAGGIQAVGHGTWLFVHDVAARSHRYLGYRSFQTQSVAISPSSEWVAWAYAAGPVFVESLGGDHGERIKLPSEPNFGTTKVRFFDDDHIVTIDGAGGIQLYRWRDAKLMGEAGVHGAIRAMHFEPDKGLILIERHNNDARVFEVGLDGFRGPYIVADQSFRAGLLVSGTAADEDAIMWTLDSGNRLRHYDLDELRSDLSQEQVLAKGKAIAPGKVAPLAIDRHGRHYGVRWNGTAMEVFVDFGRHVVAKVSAAGDVSMITPSPTGDAFVAVHQRGQNVSLSVHDTKTLDERWSFSTGVFNNEVVWSPDGRYVAVAANTGAVVLDAKTGEPVQRRCGIEFEATGAAPANAFNSLNLRSMCEG